MRIFRVASAILVAGIFSVGFVRTGTAATVTCKDGTTATGGRGACHGHGGVDKSASAGSTTSAPTAAAEPSGSAATVTCKDGATAKAGRGACHGHGGVAKAGTAESAPTPPHAKRTAPPVPAAAAPPSSPPRPPRAAAQPTSPPAQVATSTHAKAATADPSGAIARCRDGMYWHSAQHRGACSHHGGVESWTDQPRQ